MSWFSIQNQLSNKHDCKYWSSHTMNGLKSYYTEQAFHLIIATLCIMRHGPVVTTAPHSILTSNEIALNYHVAEVYFHFLIVVWSKSSYHQPCTVIYNNTSIFCWELHVAPRLHCDTFQSTIHSLIFNTTAPRVLSMKLDLPKLCCSSSNSSSTALAAAITTPNANSISSSITGTSAVSLACMATATWSELDWWRPGRMPPLKMRVKPSRTFQYKVT